MYSIKIYTDRSGKSPYEEWFGSLTPIVMARVEDRIDRLRLGNLGDTKSVGEGIHELRLQFGSGYRIYYGNIGKAVVLLLTGGDKSSQERNITNAKKYFKDYKKQQKER